MKRRFICLVVVFLLCMSFWGSAFAAGEIAPMSAVGFSSGLTRVSESTYRPWARATPYLSEDVSVGFTLYRMVDGSYTYVTSGSANANGTYVIAQKNMTLCSGSYKLYAWYTGETQSSSSNKYYTI